MDLHFYEQLKSVIPEKEILREEPMKNHTTFRIGGNAEFYICPELGQLKEALSLTKEAGVPVTVIGNGSNLLVGDGGIRGLVIEIGRRMDRVETCGGTIKAGGGALLSKVANIAKDAGLSGLEFAAGIPGSIGGAVVMNAGAYGGEMKDVLTEVTVLTRDGEEKLLSLEELDLSYRHSCIPEKDYIVTGASIRLVPEEKEVVCARMNELRERRMEKQPLEYPSAGSTFKRPEGYFAGKLIMDAGLSGYTVGGAQVSKKHCGFVINRGGATAADVHRLIADVQEKVQEQFQVFLEPEIKMIGE